MKLKVLALGALMVTGAASLNAEARSSSSGVLFTVNGTIEKVEAETGTTTSKSDFTLIDFKLGYLGGSGLYLGGMYTMRDGGDSSSSGTALGASLGYVGSKGFFIKGHYILSAEYGDWAKGTGIQVDAGYLSNVTSSVVLGVEISHRSVEYTDNPASTASLKLTELRPMLTLGFIF